MIVKFKDKKLENLYLDSHSKGYKGFPANLIQPFRDTILILENAPNIENLKRDKSLDFKPRDYYKSNSYSIRINKKFRIIFEIIDDQTVILVLEVTDPHDRD
jgi:plasmid maintenance system killer protein